MKRTVRKSVPHYTYKHSNKSSDKTIYKRIGIVLLATLVISSIVWFWGTSFISLLGLLSKPTEDISPEPVFSIPISKPILQDLPEYTNEKKITVEGSTTAGEEVILDGPSGILNTVSDSEGSFSFDQVALKKGLNLIKVYVLDTSGERLEKSFVINYDNTPPPLEILQPKDGETFPTKTEKIEIIGKTEAEATVFVNNLQSIVNPDGQFTFSFPVKKGSQTLEIESTDRAENSKKESITIIVSGN